MKELHGAALLIVLTACSTAESAPPPAPARQEPAPVAMLTYRMGAPLSDAQLAPYRACSADADCILADNGCCSCLSTGVSAAIRGDMQAKFAANFACPEDTVCSMGAFPMCNELVAKCVEKTCTAVKRR